MAYTVRKAQFQDLERIRQIYGNARQFMREHGNPTQWGDSYPEDEMLCKDISLGSLFVVTDDNAIHGVFFLDIMEDPTYSEIFEGDWHWHCPYAVIHRIAGDGTGGILKTAVQFGLDRCNHLRIDTHADNTVMQRAILKQGFSYCGIIYVEDGTPRLAYDYMDKKIGT